MRYIKSRIKLVREESKGGAWVKVKPSEDVEIVVGDKFSATNSPTIAVYYVTAQKDDLFLIWPTIWRNKTAYLVREEEKQTV